MGDEVADAIEDRAVAGDPGQTCEVLRHDEQRKVPAAARSARVSDMLRAVVGELEDNRRQRLEPIAQQGLGGGHDLLGSVM